MVDDITSEVDHEVLPSSRLRSSLQGQSPLQPPVPPTEQQPTNTLLVNVNQPSGSAIANDSGMQDALTALIEQNRLLLS